MRIHSTIWLAMCCMSIVSFSSAPAAEAAASAVRSGQSIQAAINSAPRGATVQVLAGTHHENLVIEKPITLRAEPGTVLLPPANPSATPCARPSHANGICVVGDPSARVSDVTITGFVVRGFSGSGLFGYGTEQLQVFEMEAKDNVDYGVASFAGLRSRLHDNQVRNNGEAGIYLGDSPDSASELSYTESIRAGTVVTDMRRFMEGSTPAAEEIGLRATLVRAPEVADVARLPRTNAMIAEVLRLYPLAWATGREAIEDTRIGAMRVRPRTVVLLSPWTIHRDGRFFADPEAFRPERWLDGLAQQLPRFAYYAFGGGPRRCIGNTFAFVEGALLLATIAQHHRLWMLPGQTISPVTVSTPRPAQPVMMRVCVTAEHSRSHCPGRKDHFGDDLCAS